MRRRLRPTAAPLAVAAVLAALVACTGTGTGPVDGGGGPRTASPALAPAPPTVEVEITQARSDRVARVVGLEVRNTGALDVTVTGARLTSAFVAGEADGGREVGAGRTRRLRVPLGPPACGPQVGDDPRARVELTVSTAGGPPVDVVVVPTDAGDDLRRVHGEDCAALAASAGLRLTLEDDLAVRDVDGRTVLDLVLRVEPVPGGPRVQVVSVRATTLLRPAGTTGPWAVALDSASPPPDGRLVLPAVPARCDLHAIAEDKRGTVLPVETVVDGVPQPLFDVPASDALRGRVYAAVLAACGEPSDGRG